MPRAEKTTIGVLFGRNNFILQESLGAVSEAIIENMNGKVLPEEFFTEFALQQGSTLNMKSTNGLNMFHIDSGNLVYAKDCYGQPHTVDWDEVKADFTKIWGVVKKTTKILDIRRLGIVSEYRIKVPENTSGTLLHKFTKLPAEKSAGKFTLSYENRYPMNQNGGEINEQDGFINVIEQFYDSTGDAQHSEKGFLNVTLDVQFYFGPVVSPNKCIEELLKLNGYFKKYEIALKEKLDKLGFENGNR